mmetsp:Transcript_118521/g.335261  ORF Transcript_118521/g.335261 Transcript_118521/m.335261 type:complete len:231 (-) Transcript_118521:1579-2271(-)
MELPSEAFLHNAEERFQRVCHPELPILLRSNDVQVDGQFSQGRHLTQHSDLHDVFWQTDASWDKHTLARWPSCGQCHELAVALGPDQRLAVVRRRDLRSQSVEHLEDTRDLLRVGPLLTGTEELEQHFRGFCKLVLRVCFFLVPPIVSTPLHCVKQGLQRSDAVVVASHCVRVRLHPSEDAFWEFATSRASPCGWRRGVFRNANAIDAGCVLLGARRKCTLDRRRVDAVA